MTIFRPSEIGFSRNCSLKASPLVLPFFLKRPDGNLVKSVDTLIAVIGVGLQGKSPPYDSAIDAKSKACLATISTDASYILVMYRACIAYYHQIPLLMPFKHRNCVPGPQSTMPLPRT